MSASLSDRLHYFAEDETQQRRSALRSMLARELEFQRVRPQIYGDEPYDPKLWSTLTKDVGLGGVLAPESVGGLGLGYEDFAAISGELGRRIYPGPFFGSIVLALGALLPLIEAEASERRSAAASLAEAVVAGDVIAAFGLLDASGQWSTTGQGAFGTLDNDGWHVRGSRSLVVNAPQASVILILAATNDSVGLFSVDAAVADVVEVESIDPTRPLGQVTLHDTPCVQLASGRAAVEAVQHAVTLARLAIAAESVGGAAQALEDAVGYAMQRRQFNQPIAAFQSIKHMCADGLIATQAATAALSYAAWSLDDESDEAGPALLAAKIAATDTYVSVAADAIQIHGTYGYTRDLATQCHYRRAKWLSLVLGSSSADRRELASALGV